MGLKGNLSTVSLASVFQTLSRGNFTGLLRVQAPEGPRFVEMQNGAISIAGRSAERILLGDLLLARGLLDDSALAKALELQKRSGNLLGQVLLETGLLTMDQLEDALRFQVEEEVCELFMLHKGEFDFLAGAGLDARIAPAGGLVRLKLDLNELLVEATRRAEEWAAIEQRVPNQAFLFQLTAQGASALQNNEGLSFEGSVLLRLVRAHRTVEAIVQKACLGRFNTNRMLLELWDVGLLEPAPRQSYLSVAREHLAQGRLDEARRIVDAVVASGDAALKTQTQEVLEEIKKALPLPTKAVSASVNVSADARVRSEIIRRAPANLILKKQHSVWPLAAAAILVLAAIGGGGALLYLTYFAPGAGSAYSTSRRQLEEANSQAQLLITDGKYEEGLQKLRDFSTHDPDVRKQANELLERKQKDVESMLLQAIERFTKANRASTPEELKAAADALQPLISLRMRDPLVEAKQAQARLELDAYSDSQRAAQFEQKLDELEKTAGKDCDAQLQAYSALLAEDPPESVAAKMRAAVVRLAHARQTAGRLLRQARALRDAGDADTAQLAYEGAKRGAPGSSFATEAGKELQAFGAVIAAQQADFDKIEALVTRNKSAEAGVALLKFLDAKPCYLLTLRALGYLQALAQTDEMELVAGLKAANALLDKQPPDAEGARKKIIELAEKQPYARAARAACLKVDVTSQPEGANVTVNGKQAGVTPVKADIPVLGFVRVSFSKEGCRAEEVPLSNFRAERLSVALDRIPAAISKLPVVPQIGLCIEGEQLVMGGLSAGQAATPEIVACSPQDLSVSRRIKLQKALPATADSQSGKARQPLPPMAVFRGEAFVPTGENALLAVNLAHGGIRRLELAAPPSSTPIVFEGPAEPQEQGPKVKGIRKVPLMGVATKAGYECYEVQSWKLRKRVTLAGAPKPAPLGAAFDGELVFVPRGDSAIYAVGALDGHSAWRTGLDCESSGQPALYPFVMPGAVRKGGGAVAVALIDGQIVALDAQSGTVIWRHSDGGAVAAGWASTGAGFLVLRREGTAELLPVDKKGAALWTVTLPGVPVLAPFVLRDKNSPQGKAVVICSQAAAQREGDVAPDACVLTVLAPENGAVLWRAAFQAPAVALAASFERLYVCTEDSEIAAFDLK